MLSQLIFYLTLSYWVCRQSGKHYMKLTHNDILNLNLSEDIQPNNIEIYFELNFGNFFYLTL